MTPKPPMFGSPTQGLPLPLQFLARARQFRDATIGIVDYANADMNWPKYALLLQSIELALKAYWMQRIAEGQAEPTRPRNHDLKGWYEAALTLGLRPVSELANALDILGPVHIDSSARYPSNKQAYELAEIADEAADALIRAVEPLVRKG
jgi:hypothetical protein